MKAYAERECSKLFFPTTNKMRQYEILKESRIHIVLVQLYVEPGDNFNVLFF